MKLTESEFYQKAASLQNGRIVVENGLPGELQIGDTIHYVGLMLVRVVAKATWADWQQQERIAGRRHRASPKWRFYWCEAMD